MKIPSPFIDWLNVILIISSFLWIPPLEQEGVIRPSFLEFISQAAQTNLNHRNRRGVQAFRGIR